MRAVWLILLLLGLVVLANAYFQQPLPFLPDVGTTTQWLAGGALTALGAMMLIFAGSE